MKKESQKVHCMTPFIQYFQNDKAIKTEQITDCQGLRTGGYGEGGCDLKG